jgi:hypothetical protein
LGRHPLHGAGPELWQAVRELVAFFRDTVLHWFRR